MFPVPQETDHTAGHGASVKSKFGFSHILEEIITLINYNSRL